VLKLAETLCTLDKNRLMLKHLLTSRMGSADPFPKVDLELKCAKPMDVTAFGFLGQQAASHVGKRSKGTILFTGASRVSRASSQIAVSLLCRGSAQRGLSKRARAPSATPTCWVNIDGGIRKPVGWSPTGKALIRMLPVLSILHQSAAPTGVIKTSARCGRGWRKWCT
jgi:hypothetical protein